MAQGVQVLGEERGDIFISIATLMLGRVTTGLRGGRCTWMSHVKSPACSDKSWWLLFVPRLCTMEAVRDPGPAHLQLGPKCFLTLFQGSVALRAYARARATVIMPVCSLISTLWSWSAKLLSFLAQGWTGQYFYRALPLT